MNEREMLEFAAKAAGIVLLERPEVHAFRHGVITTDGHWSPIHDDGDALRLAVKLGLILILSPREDCRGQTVVIYFGLCKIEESCYEGREKAARRAIVRAAAEIGKAMP